MKQMMLKNAQMLKILMQFIILKKFKNKDRLILLIMNFKYSLATQKTQILINKRNFKTNFLRKAIRLNYNLIARSTFKNNIKKKEAKV